VSLDGRALLRRSLELAAGGEETLVLPFTGRALGQAIARIDANDDLAADNHAFAAVNADAPLRVLLFTRGNFYLESALEALPNLELEKRVWPPVEDLARLARSHDIVVFDGMTAPQLPPGSFLLVNALAPGLPFSAAGRVAQPGIPTRGASELMRDVDLTAVRVSEARRIVVPRRAPGLQRLFWSPETDLALALVQDDRKLIYLGFDLARSNFPLQAAFPLFVSRSLEWLRPRGDVFVSTHVAAGSAILLPVPPGATQLSVRAPSGAAETLEVKGGSALFDATSDAGIYRYAAGDATRYFAVSLADARESDVNRRHVPGGRREQAQTMGDGAQALVPLWPWLLALAFALLVLEWCLWTARRGNA
jgi:hypothetical protein